MLGFVKLTRARTGQEFYEPIDLIRRFYAASNPMPPMQFFREVYMPSKGLFGLKQADLPAEWRNDKDVIAIRKLMAEGETQRARARFRNRWPMDEAQTEIDETDGALVRVLESPETVQRLIRDELNHR